MADIVLTSDEIRFAVGSAAASIERWLGMEGHYHNQWLSHLVGKLGESAAEQFFLARSLKVESHWRYPEREGLCDLEVEGLRLDIKTWSMPFWAELGRCVAVNQISYLERKADGIVWAVVRDDVLVSKEAWLARETVRVTLVGYSVLRDVLAAPVKLTGLGSMRKVKNHQLDGGQIRSLRSLVWSFVPLSRWRQPLLW